MYYVKVRSAFSGAHNLRGYKGKCEALHGHNWHVEVEAHADTLDSCGMVMDFTEIKKILGEVIARMDHSYLNDMPAFKEANPTSENIARYIYDAFRSKRPELKLKGVTVWETDNSCATYTE
jgi:6-pyruvoyltetrahydropterin/6-carboxytetrahydropterin synthase